MVSRNYLYEVLAHVYSSTKLYQCTYTVLLIITNQSINLSAGDQNITGAYVIIMLVCRRLLTTYLPGKATV